MQNRQKFVKGFKDRNFFHNLNENKENKEFVSRFLKKIYKKFVKYMFVRHNTYGWKTYIKGLYGDRFMLNPHRTYVVLVFLFDLNSKYNKIKNCEKNNQQGGICNE